MPSRPCSPTFVQVGVQGDGRHLRSPIVLRPAGCDDGRLDAPALTS